MKKNIINLISIFVIFYVALQPVDQVVCTVQAGYFVKGDYIQECGYVAPIEKAE